MKISIVLGTLFGDEGKGKTVSWLCSLKNRYEDDYYKKVVIRFNGGHQAGHTVHYNGIKHTFSSFGSGTLQGVPTIWMKDCTVYPNNLINEWNALKELGITPELSIDPLCPVTTPYDVYVNRFLNDENLKHGTCGMGFGETIKRHENNYKLYFMDLFNDFVLKSKLELIEKYFRKLEKQFHRGSNVINYPVNILESIERFYECVEIIRKEQIGKASNINLEDLKINSDLSNRTHLIFEGAQGIMLDKDFGFFPNVTRSNTTCKNISSLIKYFQNTFDEVQTDLYYVTRTYQTRHGAGIMSSECELEFNSNNREEHNKYNDFQSHFRVGKYDQNLIDYAINCNELVTDFEHNKNLVFTCADHYPLPEITNNLKGQFNSIFVSEGAETSIMKEIYAS